MNLIQDKWYILFYTHLAFLITILSYSPSPAAVNTYPANGWQTSTPEQQGMQSEMLANMIEEIKMKGYNIDSISIIRNGYMVLEDIRQAICIWNFVKFSVLSSINRQSSAMWFSAITCTWKPSYFPKIL